MTVAAVQTASVAFDLDASMARLRERTKEAADLGADLVVFPEAFLSAYPRGMSFGAVVGSRTDEGREWFARYWESSVDLPGPVTEELAAVAAEFDVTMVVGVIERDGGTLYCTSVTVDPAYGYVTKHRKLMPTASERVVWGQGDGSTMEVIETPVGRVGTAICWESYMPLYRTWLYEQGVEIYVAPTADSRDNWIASMTHIALEGRCFVVSCNQFTTEADFPTDYPAREDGPEVFTTRGGSCIIDPLGNVLAGPLYGEEGIVAATLDLRNITAAKMDFDPTGHYARTDVFRLETDRGPE